MLHKFCVMLFLGFVFSIVTPISSAQTLADLKDKYGPPDKTGHYVLRKGILLRVRAEKGRVTEMVIEPEGDKSPGSRSTNFLARSTLNDLVDELAPAARRGRHVRSIVFNAGGNSVTAEQYDRVTISTSTAEYPGKSGIVSVSVRWKT